MGSQNTQASGESQRSVSPTASVPSAPARRTCSVHGCTRSPLWHVHEVTTNGQTTYRVDAHRTCPLVCWEHRDLVAGEPILVTGPLNPFVRVAAPTTALYWPSCRRVQLWVDPGPWRSVQYVNRSIAEEAYDHVDRYDKGWHQCCSAGCSNDAAYLVQLVDWDYQAGIGIDVPHPTTPLVCTHCRAAGVLGPELVLHRVPAQVPPLIAWLEDRAAMTRQEVHERDFARGKLRYVTFTALAHGRVGAGISAAEGGAS